MTDNTQPEALRLAELLTADEWPGNMTLVSYAQGGVSYTALAKRYGTNKRTVGRIISGETYV